MASFKLTDPRYPYKSRDKGLRSTSSVLCYLRTLLDTCILQFAKRARNITQKCFRFQSPFIHLIFSYALLDWDLVCSSDVVFKSSDGRNFWLSWFDFLFINVTVSYHSYGDLVGMEFIMDLNFNGLLLLKTFKYE